MAEELGQLLMACVATFSAPKGGAGVTFVPGTSRAKGAYRNWDRISEVRQMPTTTEKPPKQAWAPAAEAERRRGFRLLIISAVVAAALFALWWLVARSNSEGDHDAELLPLFTLIPLIPALYHLLRARLLRAKGK